MLGAELKLGAEYAFREKRVLGTKLHRLRLIEFVRGDKWKVEWIQPNKGLVDYVRAAQIIVPWIEHEMFLRDESNHLSLQEHLRRIGFQRESPVDLAVQDVFESVGEQGCGCHKGELTATQEQLDRIKLRAKLDLDFTRAPAYTDRQGTVHVPFDSALELARKFCLAEPAPVLTVAEADERKMSFEAGSVGGEHVIPYLNSRRATWAILRQWCGMDAAIAFREDRILMLERLVEDAIYTFRKAGLEAEANKLHRRMFT